MGQQWDDSRDELAAALARYVGYTTGAYDITRIADVTELFDQSPSRMRLEVVRALKLRIEASKGGRAKSADGIVDFAVGLGLIRRIDPGYRIPRLALTELGRAYRSARGLDLTDYRNFLLEYAVLQFDADVSGLLLDMALDGPLPVGSELLGKFEERTRELRRMRSDWLVKAFPNPQLRERLLRGDTGYVVRWIKDARGPAIEDKDIRADFTRHHALPRRGWLVALGHIRGEGQLTPRGRELALRLRAGGNRFFWIGPPRPWFKRLHIGDALIREPLAPAWNIIRPVDGHASPVPHRIIADTAHFMETGYRYMRLVRANQVPLQAIKPYIYFLERRIGLRLCEDSVFRAVFRQFETRFAPMSQRTGLLGHYQLRKRR